MNFFYNFVFGAPESPSPLPRASRSTASAPGRSLSSSSSSRKSARTPVVSRQSRTNRLRDTPGPRLRSPPIERCVPPKCERNESGVCALPNPYAVFLRSDEARGLTVAQRKKAYAKWKQDYMAMVHDDPVAFRAALCMGKELRRPAAAGAAAAKIPRPIGNVVQKYMVGLRQRLHENQVHYVKDCDITPETVEFFNKLIPTNYAGTTLTTCEVVGLAMLRKCVPLSEVKFYTFEKVLGRGLHGFVFQCLYKGKERRAVKLVMLRQNGEKDYKLDVDGKGKEIWSVSEPALRKEFDMHHHMLRLMRTSSRFRVLNVLSKMCVFRPPRFNKNVGVYIMESLEGLKAKTLDNELEEALRVSDGTVPPLLREKAREVPRVIAELHRLGVAHSDMHSGNVAFDPKDPRRPYVLDFGRMQVLDQLGEQAQLYRMLEYAVPLHSYLRWFAQDNPVEAMELYNTYLEGVNLGESDAAFVKTKRLEYIFRRLDNAKDIKPRLKSLDKLLMDSYRFEFNGYVYSYYDATELLL